ncbi:MAG: hypothetical protein HC845_14295 [Akkermansiaceae bacterium]|nr:hypothetical protein [Akkermansiaceae bacterium]NJR43390.1 hypothetical protein [Akkermansiaceae bacterium]
MNEYEADAFSAKVTSPEMAAAALRRVKFEARRLSENFWENIGKRSKNEPEPPLQIFQEMHDFFKTTSNLSITSHWMTQAFAVATDTSDTHPGLKDRVIALGVVPNYEVPDPVTHRASEALIPGALLVRERDAFSKAWADASREYWKSTFKENHEFRQRLDSIGNDSQIDSSNEWEKIVLLQNLEGMEAVLPQLNRLLERNPDHISAHYMLGCHLLAQDDSSGIDHLERVTADPMSAMNCFGIMADFYDRHGNVDAVRALKMRADEFDDMVQQAMIGRNRVSTADNFESHGLDAAEVKKIAEIVADEALVHGAWIVQKSHELLPQWKHYVILLDIKASWFRFESVAFRNEILTRIVNQVSLDGYILAIDTKDNNRPVARKIWSIPNAKIFDRKNA